MNDTSNTFIGIVLDTADETNTGVIKVNLPTHMDYNAQDASEIKVKINKEVFKNQEDVSDDEITLTNYIECRPMRRDDSRGSGSSTFKPQAGQQVEVVLIGQNEYYYRELHIGGIEDDRSKNHNIGRTSLTSSFSAALKNTSSADDVDIISSNGNYGLMGMTDKDGLGSMAMSTGAMEVVLGELPASNFSGFALLGPGSSYYMNPGYGQFSTTYGIDKYTWKMYTPSSNSTNSLTNPPNGFEKNKIIEKSKIPYEGTFTTVKLKKKSHTEEVETTFELKDDKTSITAKTEIMLDGTKKILLKAQKIELDADEILLKGNTKVSAEVGGGKMEVMGSGVKNSPTLDVS